MNLEDKLEIVTQNDFSNMEQRYRAHFINSLSGYKSANLIATQNASGQSNVGIVSSVIHLGADPALVAFVSRPHTVERNTLENIYATKAYTINHVNADILEDAHHTSARYPANISEFEQTKLSELRTEFAAPFVEQSRIRMAVEFREKVDIELNGTILVIGEIVEVHLNKRSIQSDGKVNIASAETVAVSGLDEYHLAQSLGRLAYAKPK